MQFNTLNSQIHSLAIPVKLIPTVETHTVYFSYTANSFIDYEVYNLTSNLVPITIPNMAGYGTASFITAWDGVPDQANMKLYIELGIGKIELPTFEYSLENTIAPNTPTEIEVPLPVFAVGVRPFEPDVTYPAPPSDIIKITYTVKRCSGLYEVI